MGSLFSSPSTPAPVIPPPPANPPQAAENQVSAANASSKARAAAAAGAGFSGTNPTGGQGLTQEATTAPKSLLGS